MNSAPYILLIMNCHRYRNKALQQKHTWLKELQNNKDMFAKRTETIPSAEGGMNRETIKLPNVGGVMGEVSPTARGFAAHTESACSVNILYFHVIGNLDLETEYHFDLEERLLFVKTGDDYVSLPQKVIAAYSAILSCYSFKYIFKTDDDQMVSNCSFFSILMRLLDSQYDMAEMRYHYGGYLVQIKRRMLSTYNKIHPELPEGLYLMPTIYSSGRFYFLSCDAVRYLVKNCYDAICSEYFEDYAIGYNLADIFKKRILALDTGKYFKDILKN